MHKYYEINAPGHNVRCKVYYNTRPQARNAVVFGTGFAGHRDNRAAELFAEKALSKHRDLVVVVFNWPAHGDDVKKKLELTDCDTYLRLVVDDTRTRFGAEKLCCYATSFGAYLALKYISEHGSPFERLVLRCPVVDMYESLTRTIMKGDELERILRGKEVPVGFDRKILVTRRLLEDLQANDIRQCDYLDYAESILILHGTKDEVVPFESSRVFADEQLIEFVPVDGADHRFLNPVHMSLANKLAMEFFAF